MSVYNSSMSVILRYAAGVLKHVVMDMKERVLVFVDWPLCGWDAEMFFRVLGLNVVVINAAQGRSQRDAAVRRFNDPNAPWKSSSPRFASRPRP